MRADMTTRLASGACWLAAMVFCGLCLGCAGWQDSAYLQGLGRLVPRNAIAMHVGHSPTQAPAWQPRVRRLRSCVLTMTSEPGSSERSGRGGRQRPENVGKQIQNQPDGGEASMGRGSVLRGGYRTGGRGGERGGGGGGGEQAAQRAARGAFAGPRPTAEQIALNQALASCMAPANVLATFEDAVHHGAAPSTVNLVTALHRVAKTLTPAKDTAALRANPDALVRSIARIACHNSPGALARPAASR